MNIAVICASPNDESISRNVCSEIMRHIDQSENEIDLIDIKLLEPMWVTNEGLKNASLGWVKASKIVHASPVIIIVLPIYNYLPASSVNMFIELMGDNLSHKSILLMSSSGSVRSTLSIGALVNSLFFKGKNIIYPKTLMITQEDLSESGELNPHCLDRIGTLVSRFINFSFEVKKAISYI